MNSKIISYIIILIAFICPLIIFNGSIDDFAPLQVARINVFEQNTHFSTDEYQVPGFYVFGAIITLISGISGKDLLFLPIDLMPFLIIFFLFIYKFSNDLLIASLFTLIQLISGTTGTSSVFFWPHGLGSILYYLMIFLLLNIFKPKKSNCIEFRLLTIIVGSSLVFISYDLLIVMLFFLIICSLIYLVLYTLNQKHLINSKELYLSVSMNIFSFFLIFVVVELGLSGFFYKSILPLFKTTQSFELLGIDKFFISYFFIKRESTPLADLLISFPKIISIISVIKYSLLLLSIGFYSYIFIKKMLSKSNICINIYDTFTSSIILVSLLYGMLRLYIGQIPITLLYLPGVLCTVWLYRFTHKCKYWAIFVILFLLIFTPISTYLYFSNDLTNKDENLYTYTQMPADWYFKHGDNFTFYSDVLSANFITLFLSEQSKDEHKLNTYTVTDFEKIGLISSQDVQLLISKSDLYNSNKYFIINYNLGCVNLDNWVMLRSWRYSKDKIEKNLNINKIYDLDSVAIYSTVKGGE